MRSTKVKALRRLQARMQVELEAGRPEGDERIYGVHFRRLKRGYLKLTSKQRSLVK